MEQHIFGVTEVNNLVKLLLDNEPMLQNICVRGELSNYKMYPSGHHYFSLKDPEGAVRCVMFRGSAAKLRFRPENGMKVVVSGGIDFVIGQLTPDADVLEHGLVVQQELDQIVHFGDTEDMLFHEASPL